VVYPIGPRHQVRAQQQPQPSISLSTRVALVALAVFSLGVLPPMWNALTAFIFVGLAVLPFSQRSIRPIRRIAHTPQENIPRAIRHPVGMVAPPQPPAPPQIRHPVGNIPFRPFTAPAQETIQRGLRHPVGNRDGT